jgi:hypothetical protein
LVHLEAEREIDQRQPDGIGVESQFLPAELMFSISLPELDEKRQGNCTCDWLALSIRSFPLKEPKDIC